MKLLSQTFGCYWRYSTFGRPLKAKLIATKPGHGVNAEFTKALAAKIRKEESKPRPPKYDPNVPPVKTVEDIWL